MKTEVPEERQHLTGEVRVEPTFLAELGEKLKGGAAILDILTEAFGKGTSEVVRVLLGAALAQQASDIHIEPGEERSQVRFRIDGLLHDMAVISPAQYQGVLSRIKLLSALKLNITDRAQDGRFTIAGEHVMEIRVSSLPSEYGESLVLRVLNPKNILSLEELGLRKDLLEIFRKEITKPNGMLIVTGPTGAGKTTTLYAFLREINTPEIKIITIEDPIEYHLEGISQTQVHPEKGYTFSSGLRAIVRQDPDAILVGEIRDAETADIALQASLTGHLVLTTLHTNDAAGTITRLISLGAKPVNIAPALNLAVAQRLVRRLCKACASFKEATKEESALIHKELEHMPAGTKPEIGGTMAHSDISGKPVIKIARAKGCVECGGDGYRGRVGLFEAIVMDDELRELVLTSPSVAQLKKKAIEKGMVTLRQDGLLLVLQGITTMEEIERVTAE